MKLTEMIKEKKRIRIAFIGGSITEGAGASAPAGRWSTQLVKALSARFTGTAFEEINAGIGGTESTYGLLRLQRDVLRFEPDIVFVEFALNDESLEETLSEKAYEGLLRAMMRAEKTPYTVLVGVVANRDGRTRAKLHASIGQHYGLHLIDLQEEMDAVLGRAEPGTNKERDRLFTKDNVHPGDLGYQFYAERMLLHMEEDIFFRPCAAEKRKKDAFDFTGHFHNAADMKRSGPWELCGEGDWNLENCGGHDAGVKGESHDARLCFDFEGRTVLVGHRIGTDFGRMEVVLDGEKEIVECYYPTSNQPVTWYRRFDLEDGQHHMEISPTGDKNEKSSGSIVKIDFICTEAKGKKE